MFVWGRVVKIWLFWFFLYSSCFNYLYHIIGVDKIVISCLQLNKDKIYQYENSPTNVLLQWLLFPLINYNSAKVHFLSFLSSLFYSHSLFEFYTVLLTSFVCFDNSIWFVKIKKVRLKVQLSLLVNYQQSINSFIFKTSYWNDGV